MYLPRIVSFCFSLSLIANLLHRPTLTDPIVLVCYYLSGNASSAQELITVPNKIYANNGQTLYPTFTGKRTFDVPMHTRSISLE